MKIIIQVAAGIILAAIVIGAAKLWIAYGIVTAASEAMRSTVTQATQQIRPQPVPRRIIGYREIRVPGKPLDQCLGPDKVFNENVLRCRRGYMERVPVYNK